MKKSLVLLSMLPLLFCQISFAANDYQAIVNKNLKPLMSEYNIPGMAVAVTVAGKTYFYKIVVVACLTKQVIFS